MGCISSKLMPRSMSIKEELSQRMQRSAHSITALEELAISQNININDQFLALVYTANTVSSKLRSDKNPESVVNHDTNTWQFVSNLERGGDTTLFQRSRSLHCFTEHDLQNSQEWNYNYRGVGRSKSFHTVEEYDAMVQQIRLSGTQQSGSDGEDDSSTKLQVRRSQHIQQSHINDETSLEESSQVENPNASIANKEFEKGNKRKSIAKELDPLEIPHTIEFCTVASLREWLHSGGAYVTPKFGSYSLPSSGTANECNEGAIFNPELVAAFEERMQQLEAEAETILKQISENLEEECAVQKQTKD